LFCKLENKNRNKQVVISQLINTKNKLVLQTSLILYYNQVLQKTYCKTTLK